jgi:hypothetical protein
MNFVGDLEIAAPWGAGPTRGAACFIWLSFAASSPTRRRNLGKLPSARLCTTGKMYIRNCKCTPRLLPPTWSRTFRIPISSAMPLLLSARCAGFTRV